MRVDFWTLKWLGGTDGVLEVLDQRVLPGKREYLTCPHPQVLFEAIVTLAVRGAPAIGVAAAYGICLGLRELADGNSVLNALGAVEQTCGYLARSRPTAVNLFWALERMKKTAYHFAADNPNSDAGGLKQRLLAEAQAVESEDQWMCEAIGGHGWELIPANGAILTHCNAGSLATAGIGTALAPMYVAGQRGVRFTVYVDETRPLLQGARLTAWELTQAGIDAVLICDNMAASLMKAGVIKTVFVGADRIAANGDTANKIGTLGLSILARHFNIPFYVAAPSSTFDFSIPSGARIPIEQRHADEIRKPNGIAISPPGMKTYNPAFDVVDAEHITAFITEKGLYRPSEISAIAQY